MADDAKPYIDLVIRLFKPDSDGSSNTELIAPMHFWDDPELRPVMTSFMRRAMITTARIAMKMSPLGAEGELDLLERELRAVFTVTRDQGTRPVDSPFGKKGDHEL